MALERIERRRRRSPRLSDDHVTLAHGAGGKASAALIGDVFLGALKDPELAQLGDSALVSFGADEVGQVALTTDSFVVKPLFFPGGDIGELAVNGTVNDLAVAGAEPQALALSVVIEEGFEVALLRRIAASVAGAADRAGVRVVTGDTKVVERGHADGLYVTTTGIGIVRDGALLSPQSVALGDVVIVSGSIGDHGLAVLAARGELELESELRSDTAPLNGLVADLLESVGGVRFMRDATRGGVATVCNELALATGLSVLLDERAIPVRREVSGACEILGLDPLYVANEGKMIAVVAREQAEDALACLRSHPLGVDAAVIGELRDAPAGMVVLETAFGGNRVVDMLVGDPLPRIC
jgi:hydrogenase expression/formation protein HypE